MFVTFYKYNFFDVLYESILYEGPLYSTVKAKQTL